MITLQEFNNKILGKAFEKIDYRKTIKPIQFLYYLQGKKMSVSDLNKIFKGTYSYTHRLAQALEKLGLINVEKKGNKKIIWLSNDGEELLKKFMDYFEKWNEIYEKNNILVDRQSIFETKHNKNSINFLKDKKLKKLIR